MNLPADTHLAYTVAHEAWYWRGDENHHVRVAASAKGSGGGVAWEFEIEEMELGGNLVTRIKMFDDAYGSFAQVPELFAALADGGEMPLTGVIGILGELGAVDETERVSPHGNRMSAVHGPHQAAIREALRFAVSEAASEAQAERFEAALKAMEGDA